MVNGVMGLKFIYYGVFEGLGNGEVYGVEVALGVVEVDGVLVGVVSDEAATGSVY